MRVQEQDSKSQTARARQQETENKRQSARDRVRKRGGRKICRERRAIHKKESRWTVNSVIANEMR